MIQNIKEHSGNKYLRKITSAVDNTTTIEVDVYAVLEAFNVTCPATAHACKKALCAGLRGKGDKVQDLTETLAAINRAIELEKGRTPSNPPISKDTIEPLNNIRFGIPQPTVVS